MPSKNMRHMFCFCLIILMVTITTGILSGILAPCKISCGSSASVNEVK